MSLRSGRSTWQFSLGAPHPCTPLILPVSSWEDQIIARDEEKYGHGFAGHDIVSDDEDELEEGGSGAHEAPGDANDDEPLAHIPVPTEA